MRKPWLYNGFRQERPSPNGCNNQGLAMILPYKLATTNDQLTSRAGLLAIAHLMGRLKLSETIDAHFPAPKSNRGFTPSIFIQSFVLMQHEGSFHLDDVKHLKEDNGLRKVLNLKHIPHATTLGGWLHKMGSQTTSHRAWKRVNKSVLKATLHNCKGVTLDVDATEIIANKKSGEWTYKKNKGFMPMVGHIAETGQVVACDFRPGNACPSRENFEFIQQCEQSLPDDCFVKALRIDSAGYQEQIIRHCDEQDIQYAIRAKLSPSLKVLAKELPEEKWQPFLDKNGQPIEHQQVYRTSHCIGNYEKAFTLVIQRKRVKGQAELELETNEDATELVAGNCMYRAIATNGDDWDDSRIIHWYNQRAEDSENRIKELKLDFGAGTLPCSNFNANALYLLLSALSYNLFALMRQLLPESLAHHRALTIRWRLYAMAAKVVKTGRQVYVKLQTKNEVLLKQVLSLIQEFSPTTI